MYTVPSSTMTPPLIHTAPVVIGSMTCNWTEGTNSHADWLSLKSTLHFPPLTHLLCKVLHIWPLLVRKTCDTATCIPKVQQLSSGNAAPAVSQKTKNGSYAYTSTWWAVRRATGQSPLCPLLECCFVELTHLVTLPLIAIAITMLPITRCCIRVLHVWLLLLLLLLLHYLFMLLSPFIVRAWHL